jgi:hypothetical protein
MAKRGAARTTRTTTVKTAGGGRQTRSKKQAVAVSEVEVVEEEGGAGIDAGIAVMTTIMLVVAILFLDAHLARYDAGLFF